MKEWGMNFVIVAMI